MNRLLRDAFAEYLEFGARPVWFDNFSELPDLIRQLREMAEDAPPSWFGYSTGKWEGDTLVVDTKGFNGKAWIDQLGKPATEALHVIERFRRKDFGHMILRSRSEGLHPAMDHHGARKVIERCRTDGVHLQREQPRSQAFAGQEVIELRRFIPERQR